MSYTHGTTHEEAGLNEQSDRSAEQPAGKRPRAAVLALILIIVVGAGLVVWAMGRGKVTTDDAQVEGHLVPISPRVSGYVKSILVRDNQPVADTGRTGGGSP